MKFILIAPSIFIRENATRIIFDIYSWIYCQGNNKSSIVSLKEKRIVGKK